MDIWFYIIGSLIFLLVLALTLAWQIIRPVLSMRICVSPLVLRKRTDLPADLAACFAPAEAALQALGFEFNYCFSVEDTPGHTQWYLDLQHSDKASSATVLPAPPLSQGPGYRIIFNARDLNRYLLTANGHAHHLFALPSNWTLQDGYYRALDQQWALHCEGVAQRLDNPIRDDAEHSFGLSQELRRAYFDHLIETGWLRPSEGNTYALSFRRTLSLLWAMLRGERKAKQSGANLDYPVADSENDSEQQFQRSQADYEKIQQFSQKRPLRGWGKLLLSLVSLVVFMLVFRLAFSWEVVLILVGVLLFHESGHLLAMRWFGYRDLNVLFIPALGAVATAQKADASVVQKVIVALAGPLPGLFLGGVLLALYWPTDNTWLTSLIVMLLVLNYFNLLPIMPLDGGQVLNELLFRCHPYWQAGFFTLGVLSLLIIAWLLGAYVLILAALVLALALPGHWRSASALRAFRQTLQKSSGDLSKAVFGFLQQPRFRALGSGRRYQLSHYLLENAIVAPASKKLIGVTLVLHLTLLGLPAVLLLQIWNPWLLDDSVYDAPDWSAQLDLAADDSERWRILSEASEWNYNNEDYAQAVALAEQAAALASGFGENDPRLALSWRQQALVEDEPTAAQKLLEQSLALQERVLGPNHPELIETLQALAWNRGYDALPEQIELLQRALSIADKSNNTGIQRSLNQELGWLHEQSNKLQMAEEYYQQAAIVPSEKNESTLNAWFNARYALANFYQRRQNIGAAVSILKELQGVAAFEAFQRQFSQSALAWLYAYRGEWEHARHVYQELLSAGLETDFQFVGILLEKAYVEQQSGQSGQARALAQQALELLQKSTVFGPAHYHAILEQRISLQPDFVENAIDNARIEAVLAMLKWVQSL